MYNLLRLPKLQEAQDLHFDVMYDYVRCRLGVKKKSELRYEVICNDREFNNNTLAKHINFRLGDFLLNNSVIFREERLKIILRGYPEELEQINEEFENYLINDMFLGLFEITKEYIRMNFSKPSNLLLYPIYSELNQIFNYNTFKSWQPSQVYSSYKLAELLGMRACTYCNRDYILVHRDNDNGKLLCPQYDHWFPKSKYPLLQVSFYNLIPSCGSCNSSVKGDTVLDIENYCHPYMEWGDDEMFYYTYYLDSVKKGYRIKVKSLKEDSKLVKTIEELKIDQMYDGHIPELIDIIDLKRMYGNNYLRTLTSSFPKLRSFTKNEVYRMHFGTEKDEVDFYKKPMSKFKKDILKKLKLIDESY